MLQKTNFSYKFAAKIFCPAQEVFFKRAISFIQEEQNLKPTRFISKMWYHILLMNAISFALTFYPYASNKYHIISTYYAKPGPLEGGEQAGVEKGDNLFGLSCERGLL